MFTHNPDMVLLDCSDQLLISVVSEGVGCSSVAEHPLMVLGSLDQSLH